MMYRCKFVLLALAAVTLAAALAAGCSNSNSNDNIVSYGKIKMHYENLPDDVETVYFSLFTPAGTCIWGPKQANIADHPDYVALYQVPVRCTSLAMACYDADAKKVKYFFSTPVTITAGETLDIENPDIQDADKVSLLNYKVEHNLRAHTGDTISLQAMAVMGTPEEHYYQDITEYATWSVNKEDRLATTDAEGNSIVSKGVYRCLNTADNVEVSAAFGAYNDFAAVDITNATIASAEFYSEIAEAFPDGIGAKINSTLPLPTGADIVPVMFVAKWSDGVRSLLNSSASWENDDYTGYIAANRGRLVGIGNKPDREEKIESVQIVAKYTCNGKEVSDTAEVTVVDADLTGLALNSDSFEVGVGTEIPVFVMGVYGDQNIKVLLPPFAYKWSSDDEAVVSAEGLAKPVAESAGSAKLTASSTVKKALKASCEVIVDGDDEEETDEESQSEETGSDETAEESQAEESGSDESESETQAEESGDEETETESETQAEESGDESGDVETESESETETETESESE